MSQRPRTDLASLGVGGEQVHHLDARHQDLLLHTHVHELWGLSVDGGSPAGDVNKTGHLLSHFRVGCLAIRPLGRRGCL